jgi:hypothetical protein
MPSMPERSKGSHKENTAMNPTTDQKTVLVNACVVPANWRRRTRRNTFVVKAIREDGFYVLSPAYGSLAVRSLEYIENPKNWIAL